MSNKESILKKIGKAIISNIGLKVIAVVMAVFVFIVLHACI